MVYGHGEHIDAQDQPLGAYPSQPPQAGLQGFAQGCYICQPTVFLRRAVLRGVGGFDETQRTAFDLALWLRLLSRHPDRIGWIDALQARSRLHGACITLTQRSQVTRESMVLLARHHTSPHKRTHPHPQPVPPGIERFDEESPGDDYRKS